MPKCTSAVKSKVASFTDQQLSLVAITAQVVMEEAGNLPSAQLAEWKARGAPVESLSAAMKWVGYLAAAVIADEMQVRTDKNNLDILRPSLN